MKIRSYLLITALILFSAGLLFSQGNVEFDKDNFKSDKAGLKEALDNIKDGDIFYDEGTRGACRLALDYYLKANNFNPNNAVLNYKIGTCYLKSIQKAKCLDYFLKAHQLNSHVANDIHYKIGRGYHLNMKFDKAIESYNQYKQLLSPKDLQDQRKVIDKRISECSTGKKLAAEPERVFIDNLGDNINSSYPDYSPLISADESMMIFTSRRENTTGGGRDQGDNQYFEDIYVSFHSGDNWEPAENIGKPLNTNNNDATVGLSPDGQQLYTFFGKRNGGDILICELKGDEWTAPDDNALKKNVNTDHHESSASFSYDGKTMYFVSNKSEDSHGAHDIFISYWDEEKERWGEAKNLGSKINTEYEERDVFMHPDGRTIYFSSEGHSTIGGYDIFYSTMDDNGKWSEPVNIGYPINTPDNDRFFVMSGSGMRGYYATDKEGGYGAHDIYLITFLGPEKPLVLGNEDNLIASIANPVSETVIEETVEIKTMRLTILKGTIKDALTENPVAAEIEIVDNEKNEVISVAKSNSSTGKYLVSLPSGKNYGIAVKAEDYLFHSENFNIPAATNYQEITKDILLNKLVKDAKIILKNVFFDYAKATLRPESSVELDRLSKLLTEFPSVRIEISGHTDNKGSLKTNTTLSEARAKAVVDYLITKGISADRLEYKGYAYFQPIATNDTDEGRQLNRRVEFKVLSK